MKEIKEDSKLTEKNFVVRKAAIGKGWVVVDIRTEIGNRPGVVVDYTSVKGPAIERCEIWNRINPELKGSN